MLATLSLVMTLAQPSPAGADIYLDAAGIVMCPVPIGHVMGGFAFMPVICKSRELHFVLHRVENGRPVTVLIRLAEEDIQRLTRAVMAEMARSSGESCTSDALAAEKDEEDAARTSGPTRLPELKSTKGDPGKAIESVVTGY